MTIKDTSNGRLVELAASEGDDGITAPVQAPGGYSNAAVVTKHDVNDLANPATALVIGTAGTLKVTLMDDTDVALGTVPAGLLPLRVKRVWSTGSTANNITALW